MINNKDFKTFVHIWSGDSIYLFKWKDKRIPCVLKGLKSAGLGWIGLKKKEISRKGEWHQKWAEKQKKSPKMENGTKSGRAGIRDSVAGLSFSIPSTHPTDTSILRAPFLSTAEFSIRRPKERGNFSTLNEFWFLGPARGMATISLLILRHLHSYRIHVYWFYHFLFSIDC